MAINIFGTSISDFVAIIALAVPAILYFIGHTRSKKSEQIRISREVWSNIDAQETILEKMTMENLSSSSDSRMKMIKTVDSLINELEYFVFLTKSEMKDASVREYYRKRLLPISRTIKFINKQHPESKESGTQKILLKNITK